MRKRFIVSLIKNGIIGGSILAQTDAIIYTTNKLTIPKEYRYLKVRYDEILSATTSWFLIFPAVTLKLKNNSEHKFIIFFNRKRFINLLTQNGVK